MRKQTCRVIDHCQFRYRVEKKPFSYPSKLHTTMKKRFIPAVLLAAFLLFTPSPTQAGVPVTDIPRLIMELLEDKVFMKQDAQVQQKKLEKLLEALQEVKKIRGKQTEQLDIDVDIDRELWLTRQFKTLKMSDIRRIKEKVHLLVEALYAKDLPYLEEYMVLKKAVPGLNASNQMYTFLNGRTGAYAALQGKGSTDMNENALAIKQQTMKQYSVDVDAAQKALHTAMTYRQLSGELTDQAMDMQEKLNQDGKWDLFGIGDLFSNLFGDDAGGLLGDLVSGEWMGNKVDDLTNQVKEAAGVEDYSFWDVLLGKVKDKAESIGEQALSKVTGGGSDIVGVLDGIFGTITDNILPAPEYATRIEKDGLKMTTGERIEAQAAALENIEKSMELELEADRLVLETTEKTPAIEQVEQAYENALFRKTLSQMQVE